METAVQRLKTLVTDPQPDSRVSADGVHGGTRKVHLHFRNPLESWWVERGGGKRDVMDGWM